MVVPYVIYKSLLFYFYLLKNIIQFLKKIKKFVILIFFIYFCNKI